MLTTPHDQTFVSKNAADTLKNAPARLEIRPDFPKTLRHSDIDRAITVIGQELQKHGENLETAKRIVIAYPHKHPDLFPTHENKAARSSFHAQRNLKDRAPHIDRVTADGICETVCLARAQNQTSLHALMRHQIYGVHMPSQKKPLSFLHARPKEKEFFVIVDACIEQGTTIANLMSYTEYNGGNVLAAIAGGEREIAQQCSMPKSQFSIAEKFNTPARNTGRLPQLAEAFAISATEMKKDWSPQSCLEKFNAALQKHGNSVYGLTDQECLRLIHTVKGEYFLYEPLPVLLDKLEKTPPSPRVTP